jgi:cyclic pyranopterin phosphate synthase
MDKLSHLDKQGKPQMVDVGSKKESRRTAKAVAILQLPENVYTALNNNHDNSGKGPVFETAILAGIMAAKKTSELIPLCHPLPFSHCALHISWQKDHTLCIQSEVSVEAKTGVEMEALTAVSIAALTVYDMCKGMSHDILIKDIRLLSKSGGKKDFSEKSP